MRTLTRLALAIALLAPVAAHSAPRKPTKADTVEVEGAKADLTRAKARAKVAQLRAKAARSQLKATKAKASATKAAKQALKASWIAECVYERTGPTGGIDPTDAEAICEAEYPDYTDAELRLPIVQTEADWMRDCIYELSVVPGIGPTGGVPVAEAKRQCTLELAIAR